MSLKHLVFIVNPRAGVERVKEIQDAVTAQLDADLYSHEIQYTSHGGHGAELAADAARNGAYAVVAVGGDGSVNDIARGLLGTETALGIIPKGSGNGTARNMGLPLELDKALAVINRGKTGSIDIGFANDRAFLSNAGVAFDALVSREFAQSDRRGFWIYSWLVTKHLWLYKPMIFDICVDGKKLKEKAFMLIVANGKQFGYDFTIAPLADHTDGLLDVIVIRNFPRIFGGLIALKAMKGNILNSRYATHLRGKEITVTNPALKLMQTDGDAHECQSEISFSVQHSAIRIMIP